MTSLTTLFLFRKKSNAAGSGENNPASSSAQSFQRPKRNAFFPKPPEPRPVICAPARFPLSRG